MIKFTKNFVVIESVPMPQELKRKKAKKIVGKKTLAIKDKVDKKRSPSKKIGRSFTISLS